MAKRTPKTDTKYRAINRHGIALSAGPTYLAGVDALALQQRRSRSSLLEYAAVPSRPRMRRGDRAKIS